MGCCSRARPRKLPRRRIQKGEDGVDDLVFSGEDNVQVAMSRRDRKSGHARVWSVDAADARASGQLLATDLLVIQSTGESQRTLPLQK